ncbi:MULTISPECIES: FAD-binding and (Fe-S)-binding domain-containing protein [unclassified Rhizobium]|uniref:D-2-hydroxyglutarate dehydrogenase YdiJ n=1 Tax=unclassified Rhizobium TaxID=2613769 RepID=UPI001612F58F|nr:MULTISPECIES: FAD-binding and (Fe-S)-binding domain-containing protein [unclassified Rhizobium]MBB3285540.1 FAD/FMN-containing dehydrogenase/Fe-S oxidoreductase [Rhizobium sp. BK252]MBB3400280.1 FAD/FMN-containing dehydrogenase/Fe-S oxidoreductase [Rhizobium sp. BK289]MBB3412859.1 FAD/FMN-containing dehydrogenase/Fe-S oxidoreductase [Rhizobium sp. BK284]MBB3480746.1 FAD/FMN-containing dehydrogenase/Fe-S oxidoreductase [Rhizobium sp. BK347]
MIPRLVSAKDSSLHQTGAFARRLSALGFQGDVETEDGARTVASTDNSIYQVKPAALLYPRGADDLKIIAKALSEPAFSDLVITPRGGGTGTNGQSLTSGVVVDCSRHMNRILEIDPVRKIARVEAGVVKDQLNKALKPYGLFFAPELSTSDRATIGGMISTDACGQGSCLYGKTSNHVLGLRVVLCDGSDWWSRPLGNPELDEIKARDDRIGEIHRVVDAIARDKSELIAATFPKLNRYMTGYDLAHIRCEDGRFDLNAVLCGSEGTLAMIAEAELNVLPIPAQSALINIRYDDFNTALEDARRLVALKVASVETVDEKVLGLAKGDIVWSGIAHFFPEDASGSANGINIVEVLADDRDELERKLADVTAALDDRSSARHKGYTVAREKSEIEAIWSMRKRAVGLLGNVEGPVRPVPFVEDTAVPPEHLAAYIREFRALLDAEGLDYGMFGHVDAGVLHVRPALDLTRADHQPLVRRISDGVVALTRKYGGVLWGEHGKGVRSEYVPEYFGELYPSLQDIKRAFDPGDRLNPGKIASGSSRPLLKIDEVSLRGDLDRIIGNDIRAAFDNAAYCNGNGACFDFDATSPMCPSFKATGDRRYSPKGRAALMREWLRLLAERKIDPRREAEALRRANPFGNLLRRTVNSLNPANRDDFSHEVRAAMDTCLACKACAGQCPVKVSVPAFRSKFLELYYGRYVRPLKDPIVAAIETTLPLMARFKLGYNLLTGSSIGQALMRLAGLTALPAMPAASLEREAARLRVQLATPELLGKLSAEERTQAVVIVADVFSTYFDPAVVIAALKLALKMGFKPWLAMSPSNGKALHVHGYLGRFEKAAVKSRDYLDRISQLGISLVGIDPSMTLTYRGEYAALPSAKLQAPVLLLQEWLGANLDRLPPPQALSQERFTLLAHCTEKTNAPAALKQWSVLFGKLGIRLDMPDVGCCGMAGTFGHEVRNRAISEKLYAMSWQDRIAENGNRAVVMATGFSCRSQVAKIDHQAIPHPVEILERLIS